jgi:excisionase family DNA binding protein
MADDRSSNPGPSEDPWLTVPQVAAELMIHPATVRIWIKGGRLRAARVGREWRVRRSDVEHAVMADPAAAPERAREPDGASFPTPAPMRFADHLMAVTPAATERS